MSRGRSALVVIPIVLGSMLLAATPVLARGTLDQKQEETSGVNLSGSWA